VKEWKKDDHAQLMVGAFAADVLGRFVFCLLQLPDNSRCLPKTGMVKQYLDGASERSRSGCTRWAIWRESSSSRLRLIKGRRSAKEQKPHARVTQRAQALWGHGEPPALQPFKVGG
jgi:hypothetical protein